MGATFFTQITMLNMLIAIMADTYERVSEDREAYALKNKLLLMKEYGGAISREYRRRQEKGDEKKFLVAISVLGLENDLGPWLG